jgi:hypothetical protein
VDIRGNPEKRIRKSVLLVKVDTGIKRGNNEKIID